MNRFIQNFKFSSKSHYPIVVIGGGTAGLNFTAQMIFHKNVLPNDIVVINPQSMHAYQPGWTMVGGGIYDIKKTLKPNNQVFPKNVNIIKESCVHIDAQNSTVVTDGGQEIVYQQLVVVPGMRLDWEQIIGAQEALDDDFSDVASIYYYKYAVKMNKLAQNFQGGKAIFTEPQMPIKCAGAPQKVLNQIINLKYKKIVYLSNDRWKKQNIQFEIEYNCAKNCIFGVPKYAQILENFARQQNIGLAYKSKLVEIKKDKKIAVFQNLDTQEKIEKKYDLLHIVPPQKSFSFIKESGLADANGFVDVDMGTMQHKIHKNIWSMGDASNLPTSKTAAAIMSQTPILISNLMNEWKKQNKSPKIYEGYSSCPIFTSQSQLLLAEFKYDGIIDETFGGPIQRTSNHLMFQLKKSFFPFAYWHLMSKGVWGGRNGLKIFQI